MYFSENFRSFRTEKGMTQEDVADRLGITPQSVSKWERGETYPDITFLPAIAMIFDTSIDRLIGMDAIRSVEVRWDIHNRATNHLKSGEFDLAEKVYREALITYPNKPGMILGLAGVLAMKGDTEEAIALMIEEINHFDMRVFLAFLRVVHNVGTSYRVSFPDVDQVLLNEAGIEDDAYSEEEPEMTEEIP